MFALLLLQNAKEITMARINMTAWKHKVNHNCLHALQERGYRCPTDIACVRVSRLLQIPGVDANDVADMLMALYETTFRRSDQRDLPSGFDLSREELAKAIHELCEEYGFDKRPKRLLSLTAMELIVLTANNIALLPQMVRKIKHLLLGKTDPEELLKLPSVTINKREGRWWASSFEPPTWEEQLQMEELEEQGNLDYDYGDDLPAIHRRRHVREMPAFC